MISLKKLLPSIIVEQYNKKDILIYGGIWSSGKIIARKADDLHIGHTREMGRNRWIYVKSKQCVFWWNFPVNVEDKHTVENYLHRMGYVVEYHRNMNMYYEPILNMNENILK